jgi:serine/threonine protein kinase
MSSTLSDFQIIKKLGKCSARASNCHLGKSKFVLLISFVGDGAYSQVYKVRRQEDQAVYALKKVKMLNLSDKEKENALNEVRILASINHQGVIAYKEAFIDEASSCLW